MYGAPEMVMPGVEAAPAALYVQGAVVENAPVCVFAPAVIADQAAPLLAATNEQAEILLTGVLQLSSGVAVAGAVVGSCST